MTRITDEQEVGVEPVPDVPRRGWMRRGYDWVLHWAHTPYGTPALAGVSFAESSFFPVPPDPLLMALAVGRPRRALFFAFVCSAASVLGGLFGYWIGVAAMQTIGQPIIEFYGQEKLFAELQERFLELGFLAVLGAALTPIPYKVFTIAAGACSLPLGTFVIASIIGRSARFFAEGILIRYFGEPIKAFIDRYFNILCVVFFLLLIIGFVVVKWMFE